MGITYDLTALPTEAALRAEPSTLAPRYRKAAQSNGAKILAGRDYVEGGAVGREIGRQGNVLCHHRIGHVLASRHRRNCGGAASGRARANAGLGRADVQLLRAVQ